mgnify:FL=1
MKKKSFILLVGIVLSLTGCDKSISQEDYNAQVEAFQKLQEDYDAKVIELENMQESYDAKLNELEILQADYDAKVKELDIAKKDMADLQNKLKSENEELTELQTKFENIITSETKSDSQSTDIKYKDLNGRGYSDSGREEPSYKNVFGYIAVGYDEEFSLSHSDSYTNTPWIIPTYEKDKQFYIENGTIAHKTEIVVLEQELEHEGYGAYSGYLLVKKVDSAEQFYINVNNFITKPYWTYNDIQSAAKIGYIVAEYKQTSDYYPVNQGNNKVDLDSGTRALITGTTGTYGSRGPNKNTNSIETIIFKEWEYGYGGVSVFFNSQDLSIVY